jgi:hypothetical protein
VSAQRKNKPEKAMQDFSLTYWFDNRTSSSSTRTAGASVGERVDATTVEEVIARVEANLARPTFVIDLGGEEGCPSLALIRSESVRYVHIEALGEACPRPAYEVDGDTAGHKAAGDE